MEKASMFSQKGPSPKISMTPEMLDQVRLELQRSHTFEKRHIEFPRYMSVFWSDLSYVLTLERSSQTHYRNLRRHFNKPTCFYWKSGAHRPGRAVHELNRDVIAGVYKEWVRCHNGTPNIDYDKFFASPVRITPDGPATTREIVQAHRLLCEQLRWTQTEHHKLLSLFRAIIVIHDEYVPSGDIARSSVSNCLLLDDYLTKQSVLLVKTGDESELSAPISFESLEPTTLHSPKFAAKEVSSSKDTIRVSLSTAVKFIAGLNAREEASLLVSRCKSKSQSSLAENQGEHNKEEDEEEWDEYTRAFKSAERCITQTYFEGDGTIRDTIWKIETGNTTDKLTAFDNGYRIGNRE